MAIFFQETKVYFMTILNDSLSQIVAPEVDLSASTLNLLLVPGITYVRGEKNIGVGQDNGFTQPSSDLGRFPVNTCTARISRGTSSFDWETWCFCRLIDAEEKSNPDVPSSLGVCLFVFLSLALHSSCFLLEFSLFLCSLTAFFFALSARFSAKLSGVGVDSDDAASLGCCSCLISLSMLAEKRLTIERDV